MSLLNDTSWTEFNFYGELVFYRSMMLYHANIIDFYK